MGILRFESWCENAVSGIRDKQDRARVYGELYAHMEDQYEELIAGGMSETEAEKAVVSAMGDFGETAKQLERLYPPVWGRLLLAARLVLLLAFLMAVFTVPNYLRNLHDQLLPPPSATLYFGEEGLLLADGHSRDRRTYYAEPMSRDSADGYRFTLTRLAERRGSWWNEEGDLHDFCSLYLRVEVYHPSLWDERSEILREFYAVDSLGNRYEALNLSDFNSDERILGGNPHRSGLFSYSWDMWLAGYIPGAEWIEVRYDKAGRSVRLRAELKGGGAE